MITLITGVPGTGKTLRTIELMDGFVKEGRPCWTDIEGINLKGVMSLPKDWGGHWRDFDDGTVFVIDEVQKLWRGTGRSGMTKNPDVMELEEHRHRGMDFILTTQHPTFVENHVRKLVGKHEHINRPRGSRVVGISSKDHYFDITDRSELSTADFTGWKHPKKYYGSYKSATIHTHQFKLPKKLVFALGSLALLLAGGLYALTNSILWNGVDTDLADKDTNFPKNVPAVLMYNEQDWANIPTREVVQGCISSESKCVCYGAGGRPLQLSIAECFTRMEAPLPMLMVIGGTARESQSANVGSSLDVF